MNKSLTILVLLCCFGLPSFAQNTDEKPVIAFSDPIRDYKTSLQKNPALLMRSWNYGTQNYGTAFFCRMEKKWEKKSGHGIKFRLGDIQTVDYLEGKINLDQTNLRPQ